MNPAASTSQVHQQLQCSSAVTVEAHVLISSKAEAPQEVCIVSLPPLLLPHLAQASTCLLQP